MKQMAVISLGLLFVAGGPAARGEFATVINVPPDAAPAAVGSDTQLNLGEGGVLPANFEAGAADGSSVNVEVNISGGLVDHHFFAYAGSVINVSGGLIKTRFWPHAGSIANITGGTFEKDFTLGGGSTTTLFGGVLPNELHALFRSEVHVYGGLINKFQAHEQADASFYGDAFFLDGIPIAGLIPGQPVTISERDVPFSGVLTDGSSFNYDLISAHVHDQGGPDVDHFHETAILTVTWLPATDFDDDFSVDGADLAILEASFGLDDAADANWDGISDGRDLVKWQRQLYLPSPASTRMHAIPEPTACALFCCAAGAVLACRRLFL